MHSSQKLINHVALVLDGSSSMESNRAAVIKVADEQIKHLALRSEELSQETRVSVYLFDYNVKCLIFDMDVMRLPSIADLYRANGMTALIDATIKSQQDLATTSQLYGDHAFLTFVLTDGMENYSSNTYSDLSCMVLGQAENWSLAFLVPDRSGKEYVRRLGISDGNIAIWDTTSAKGMLDAGKAIRNATETFMTNRATGVRGSRSVFSTSADVVNYQTVSETLAPLDKSVYALHDVGLRQRVDEYCKNNLGKFVRGSGYYQLTKTETIQPQKALIVVDKRTGVAYGGAQARNLVGLPDNKSVRVRPDANPKYDIFVQSTSINRILVPGTKLLVKS